MSLSPYTFILKDLLVDFNDKFRQVFNLSWPYRRDDIPPGSQYGFIDVRSLDLGKANQTGFQIETFQLEILITFSCLSFPEAIAQSAGWMLELDCGIPKLKELLSPGAIYDLKLQGDIATVRQQSIKPPRPWIVDVTAKAIAPMQIYKDKNGLHVLPPFQTSASR